MAYDADRHFSVLFGGMSIGGDFHDLSDLWGWNGLNWTALSTSPVPPGRHFHTLAYDSVRGKLVMFGGRIGRDVPPLRTLGDTWEFDGNHWTQAVVPGPSPRGGSCMAFDAARNQMVLFGGEFGLDDTWVYRFGAVGPDPTIGAQPESRSVPFGEGVSFAVLAQGGGELTYQWRKDTVALTDDSRIGGSSTATLVINPISSSDGGVYDVVVSNPCTSATSDPATLTVSSCPADFNLDGVQNTQDYFDFVNAFFASAPSADFDHSGVVDSSDFFAFLTAFFAGCGL
jgi:hypothetical protein